MSKQAFKRMRRHCKLEVSREPLPSYAWPGGYPLVYVMSDGGCLCPDCVNKEIDNVDDSTRRRMRDGWQMEGVDVNYEDESLFCDHCGKQIPAAYGE